MITLNVPLFGIVDCSLEGGKLHVYPYHEGMGKKDCDNVASLFMLFLKQKGWLKDDFAGKVLMLITDNCGGQNKNNNILWLAVYLVKSGYFKKVECLFFVAGHTKNVCNRWFNT